MWFKFYRTAILGRIVMSVDIELRKTSHSHLLDIRHEVIRDSLWILTDSATLMRSHGVEVPQQNNPPFWFRCVDVSSYFFKKELHNRKVVNTPLFLTNWALSSLLGLVKVSWIRQGFEKSQCIKLHLSQFSRLWIHNKKREARETRLERLKFRCAKIYLSTAIRIHCFQFKVFHAWNFLRLSINSCRWWKHHLYTPTTHQCKSTRN